MSNFNCNEAELREQIAKEIEAQIIKTDRPTHKSAALRLAARIVRKKQER